MPGALIGYCYKYLERSHCTVNMYNYTIKIETKDLKPQNLRLLALVPAVLLLRPLIGNNLF